MSFGIRSGLLFAYAAIVIFLIIPQQHGQVLLPSLIINCTTYDPNVPCLPGDRSLYCLTNGSTIQGLCKAQIAVCQENVAVADSLQTCYVTTPPGDSEDGNDNSNNNTATTSRLCSSSSHLPLLSVSISSSMLLQAWRWVAP